VKRDCFWGGVCFENEHAVQDVGVSVLSLVGVTDELDVGRGR
jgi:hypothetical protein